MSSPTRVGGKPEDFERWMREEFPDWFQAVQEIHPYVNIPRGVAEFMAAYAPLWMLTQEFTIDTRALVELVDAALAAGRAEMEAEVKRIEQELGTVRRTIEWLRELLRRARPLIMLTHDGRHWLADVRAALEEG